MKKMIAVCLAAALMVSVVSPVYADALDGTEAAMEEQENNLSESDDKMDSVDEDFVSAQEEILNEAQLSPTDAQSDILDEYVDELLGELVRSEMTTEEKVRTCYDYLVENVQYGSHTRYLSTQIGDTGVSCNEIYANYGEIEGFGAVALTAEVGMCNAYASAFILMTRALGLDSHLVEGSTGSARGGYAYHKWAEVDIEGTTYVFDPQLEQSLQKHGLPAYSVFCKTYDQIPGRYIRKARND